jgi:molybdopterin converting factor small subunit
VGVRSVAEGDEVRVRILQLGRQVIEYRGHVGETVATALTAVALEVGPGVDIRVNGIAAEGATTLRDGDVVTLIPRIKGG